MIKVGNVSVRLGARLALDAVTFEAHRGELICLLGPNGAGKTTLLRSLAGLVEFDGTIEIDGQSIGALDLKTRAAQLSYLPQVGPVHWPLTAWDVVAIGRLPYSSSLTSIAPADRAAIETALELADAKRFAGRLVTELSGGERARVLLARALAVESPILLADEPLAALDPEHQLGCIALLCDLAKGGRLVIAAVHDISIAARFGGRVIVLDGGRLVADGAPAAVLRDDLLKQVFAVDAVRLEHDGSFVLLPWQRNVQSRDK